MKKLIVLFSLFFSISAFSQTLSVFDVDVLNFPTVKAKFFAFDASGNQITNLSPSDFEVKENGQPRSVTYVSCPQPKPLQALSSVLTIDVSGSMLGSRLKIVKDAAVIWVNSLSLGQSECAITSFDDRNYLNQDYTTNRDKLLNAINNLKAMGGTDYDVALINPLAGGLLITKSAKYKRVIILLTDGMPNREPRTGAIIQEANQQGVVIYGVTLGMPCPQSIKAITTQTGGQWFENVTTVDQAREVYLKLLQTAQGGDPCTIEWQSDISCTAGITNVELTLLRNGAKATTNYQSPNTSIAKLEFNPTSVKFENPAPGVSVEQQVTVTARNADFTVSDISTKVLVGFNIAPKSFNLKAGQSIELTVSYFPADSGYNYCRFDIESQPCPTRFYVSGGWKGKKPTIRTIKLIHPNGGEVFVAGSDTVITWEGVSPDEPVKIEYSIDNGANWLAIADSAIGLSYKWRVPKTPSNQCLARVTAAAKSIHTSDIEMVLIPAGTFQMGNTGSFWGESNEKPVHTVTISRDFLMSKYEVTQKQYEEVMGTNPSYFKGENLPVERVTWYDAVAFCNKISELEGLELCYTINGTNVTCDWDANGYRLPTEAEWEYACKAGTTTDFYNGSLTNKDDFPLDNNLDKIGWYDGNDNTKTREVGQKEPNAFGLYDMSGNVWEWCWDWFGNYTSGAVTDPIGPSSGRSRVYRGGSWNYFARYCRSASRDYSTPDSRYNYIGFRIVRTN